MGVRHAPLTPPKGSVLPASPFFPPSIPLLPSSLPIAHPPHVRIWPSCMCRVVAVHEGVLPLPLCAARCFLSSPLSPRFHLCNRFFLPSFSGITCRPPALLPPLSSLVRVPPVQTLLVAHTTSTFFGHPERPLILKPEVGSKNPEVYKITPQARPWVP
jgi:hypothetical protein